MDDERAVLGDELQQRGDPQGELIALQLALESCSFGAKQRVLESKIARLLDQHHDALYGPLAPHVNRASRPDLAEPVLLVKAWRGGFADTVWLTQPGPTGDVVEVLRTLLGLSIGRFVRRIELGGGDHDAAVRALADTESLRELALGAPGPPLSVPHRRKAIEPTSLLPLLPQLEVLEIEYSLPDTIAMSARALRKLALRLYAVDAPPTRLFDIDAPLLEELECNGFRLDRAFFDRYPRLRRAAIYTTFEPGWFEHVLLSGAIERLETLALTRIGDAELMLIAQHADRFANMARLDLRYNTFSAAARAAVAGQLPACVRYR